MLEHVGSLLSSTNAITASCIGSWAVTSISIDDMINRPIQSVFWPLFCGGIAGGWITGHTPEGFGPYVAAGIIGMTTVGLIAKSFRTKAKVKTAEKHWSLVLLEALGKNSLVTPSRFSYSAHNILKGQEVELKTEKELNSGVIRDVLIGSMSELDPLVASQINNIGFCLSKVPSFDNISSVFIHDNLRGYVMINGPKKEVEHVLSFNINP